MKTLWSGLRLRWVTIITASAFAYIWSNGSGNELLKAQAGVLAWKVALVGVAVTLAHQFRKQVFPYLDLSEIVKSDDTRSGLFFLGIMIFYAAVILSLTGGL